MEKTKTTTTKSVALAFYPHPRAIGFGVMDSPTRIVESGCTYVSSKNIGTYLIHIANTIHLTNPAVVILEDHDSRKQHRLKSMQQVFLHIEDMVRQLGYPLCHYSRKEITTVFGGLNKPEIAEAIAEKFDDYTHRLPKKRKFDEAESPRMSEFDALSLVYTHFHHEQKLLSNREGT